MNPPVPRRLPKAIEVVSEPVAAILRTKTIAERAQMISDAHKASRESLKSIIRHQHPEWDDEQVRVEMVRRLIGGAK